MSVIADGAPRHTNLNLTPEEKRVFYQLFQAADTTNLGVITGEVAVPFFEKTKLPPETLGLIWQIADKENRGLLTPSGFSVVLRLIGHAQVGRVPTEELALQPGPFPKFDGIAVDIPPSAPRSDAGAGSPPPGATGSVRVPPLNPDDVVKFASLFEKSGGTNGIISGEVAKHIFERARLPNEILGRIWNLADTKQRGALDATEFVIAMHLLTSYKSGAMRVIPQTLPPGLYEAASRRGSLRPPGSPRSGFGAPTLPSIPKQFTGPQRTQSPINRQQFSSPLSAQSTGGDWLVTPQEKTQFDSIFATVDTAKSGFLSGDQAVTFFMNAQLPEETLAQIWDLADIDADGQLSRDEFAVAMHLVRLVRSGKEPLPQAIPPALVPPSMRRRPPVNVPSTPAAVPAPVSAPAPAPHSAAEDLFGLDAFTAPVPAPAAPSQVPQSTGGSNSPFAPPGSPSTRAPQHSPPSNFKPFVPTSSFGQSLQPQLTGQSVPAPKPAPSASEDLLGDNDPEESKKLTQDTADLANLSNQIGSLSKEMHNIQEKRTSAEHELSQTSQQKRDFETRLSQARAMYEQEVKNFKALEERLKASKAETTKLQQEYALLDGSRQDLQNQYNQVSAALAADQQENAGLKEKIRKVNAEIAQLKPALEKARSDARQQKGLAAINKKQLATVEDERDKIQSEIDTISKENERAEEAVAPAAVTSPAASTTSQNTNPFFRRTVTASSSDYGSPPASSPDQQAAFDNLFGPAFAPPASVTPPPPISFRSASPSVQQSRSKSPVSPGVLTPSTSPPPASSGPFSEPASLAQSRQITPLPFGESQSVAASAVAALPASGAATQQPFTAAALPPVVTSSGTEPSHESATAQQPLHEAGKSETTDSGISAATSSQSGSAFPSLSDEKQGQAKDPSFDELFGDRARERSQSQRAKDFDEAFAAIDHGPANGKPHGNATAADTEFPPIRELDNDDDDSTDSEAPMGFDDNFTPVSPPRVQGDLGANSIDQSQLAAFPMPNAMTTERPPPADAQTSPPKYTEGNQKQEAGFPPEFGGLLPSRTDPTAPPDAPHSVESSTGAPIVHGEPQHDTLKDDGATSNAKKSTAPDFEAAFAGLDLAPAKETEDDDKDSESGDSNGNPADFEFSFDSPPQSKTGTLNSHSGQAPPSGFFGFNDNANGSPSAFPAPANPKPVEHDWDAIFAPLENAKSPAAGSAGAETGTSNDKSAQPAASDPREPGWALAADGEDDLILQRLTGMGFPRDKSLDALEKFDYNLDKVSFVPFIF
ncbi:hypothetical protein MAP00_001288 [Monascus purpureus]|nr:hypothetical protein MAP00_001288 [Monascus purpureus]